MDFANTCIKRIIGILFREISLAYAVELYLDPHLYLIVLWISGHKMMFLLLHVGRKRYGFGYLLSLGDKEEFNGYVSEGISKK